MAKAAVTPLPTRGELREDAQVAMKRRPHPAELRQIIRDEFFAYRSRGGSMRTEDAVPAIRDRIQEEYGESDYILVLLELVAVLVPLLLKLFSKEK